MADPRDELKWITRAINDAIDSGDETEEDRLEELARPAQVVDIQPTKGKALVVRTKDVKGNESESRKQPGTLVAIER